MSLYYSKQKNNLRSQLIDYSPRGNMLSKQNIFSSLILDLKNMAEQICMEHKNNDSTIFLFIGSSPAYLYYYFKYCIPRYRCALIPISYLSSLWKGLRPEGYVSFKNYLNIFIDISKYSKIVIVDHSHTGESIIQLVKLLSYASKGIQLYFCDIMDNVMSAVGYDEKYMKRTGIKIPIKIIRGYFVNMMSGHEIPRLTQQIGVYELEGKTQEQMRELLQIKTGSIENGLKVLSKIKPYLC
jgi:hypothetical protein